MGRLSLSLALALAAAAAAARDDAAPLALAEGQVVTLQFARPVGQLGLGDLAVVQVKAVGSRVEVVGLRGGRTSLVVQFEDGGSVSYDVQVAGARRASALPAGEPNLVELRVGEQRRLPASGAAQLLLEENGVARVAAERGAVVVTGVAPGTSSLIVVDGKGNRSTYPIRVR
ncbi:MAG TPA: pilus assembly protein N-terminal domain-containing protein [Anaeromyxobacteraceae bacterium]